MVRHTGSGRIIEGGALSTRKYDFNQHVNGQDFKHFAQQILLDPEFSDLNLQQFIEVLASRNTEGFITLQTDGYTGLDISPLFAETQQNSRLQNGGIILIKSGTHIIQNTVVLNNGITLMGEPTGTILIGEMQNEPMFVIQEAQTKNDINPGILDSLQSQSKNRLQGLVFYDNLNGTLFSGDPSMSTQPMIRCNRGSELTVDCCVFIGRATSAISVSKRAIGYNSSTVSTNGTHLTVQNSYIDGFLSSIEFDATLGALDILNVHDNTIRTLGDNAVSGLRENRYGISFTNCNAKINNNHHLGISATWGSSGFLYIKDTTVTDTDTSLHCTGNSGEIIGDSSAAFLYDGRTSQETDIKMVIDNPWGDGFGNGYFNAALRTEQFGYLPRAVTVNNALITSGLELTYPHESHIRLNVSSLPYDSILVIDFTETPLDGSVLKITCTQDDSDGYLEGILLGNNPGSSGSPGFDVKKNNYFALKKIWRYQQTFSFIYDSVNANYVLEQGVNDTVFTSGFSRPDGYEATGNYRLEYQKSSGLFLNLANFPNDHRVLVGSGNYWITGHQSSTLATTTPTSTMSVAQNSSGDVLYGRNSNGGAMSANRLTKINRNGYTWSSVSGLPSATTLPYVFYDGGSFIVIDGALAYLTTSGTAVGAITAMPMTLSGAQVGAGHVGTLLIANNNTHNVYRTDDSGSTWTACDTPASAYRILCIIWCPFLNTFVACGHLVGPIPTDVGIYIFNIQSNTWAVYTGSSISFNGFAAFGTATQITSCSKIIMVGKVMVGYFLRNDDSAFLAYSYDALHWKQFYFWKAADIITVRDMTATDSRLAIMLSTGEVLISAGFD